MDARAYLRSDREACLALLERRGLALESNAFAAFLDAGPENFVVLLHEGLFLGCGGIASPEAPEAALVWGMIDPAWERRGLGRFLLLYRSRMCRSPLLAVTVRDEFAAIYEKAGFRRTSQAQRLIKKMEVCA